PALTIEENLSLALLRGRRRGLGPSLGSRRRARFREQLETLELGLEDRLTTKVGLLSGGQRQAPSLLMAGFTHQRIMLLAEHTAARNHDRPELANARRQRLVTDGGPTAPRATHNTQQAIRLGNRHIMMHEGRIVHEADHEKKASLTVQDLLSEFSGIKGAT